MRHKRIAFVGASLIIMIGLFSGLTYYFNQDKCPVGTFLCKNSTTCMPQRSWCNGKRDCPNGDDELKENCIDVKKRWRVWFKSSMDWNSYITNLHGIADNCDILDAPPNCSYSGCSATCNYYTDVPQNLSPDVAQIFLSHNSLTYLSRDALSKYLEIRALNIDHNDIVELEERSFSHQSKLSFLDLSDNKVTKILPGHLIGLKELKFLNALRNKIIMADFSDLENSTTIYSINLSGNMLTARDLKLPQLSTLKVIILKKNRFESITEDLFTGCVALEILSMKDNRIINIDENAFRNLQQLYILDLTNNRIATIPSNTFQPVNNLSQLLIGYNPVVELPKTFFKSLKYLRSLDLEDINMENMDANIFDALINLDYINFKKFHYCMTYAPNVRLCKPNSDGVSSLSHLLDKPVLRAAVWSISLVTCLGNSLVLWGRYTAKNDDPVLSIVIKNLAVADMLMGIYLFMIAIEDERFRNRYKEEASAWMSSWECAFLGALAMTSSEVSVLILSFMSVEKFLVIVKPLNNQRATSRTTTLSMIIIWIVGITLALIPVIYWWNSTRFYGVNGMCFPLHIDDPYMIGWKYSGIVFLGVNFLGLMIMGYVYTAMFISIWTTRHSTTLPTRDSEYALRFFLIVLTDAACWVPIIALKILAMMKYPVSPHLHAWILVFILPINSAINPLLYTFTTSNYRERVNEGCFGKLRSYKSRHSVQDLQEAVTTANKTTTINKNIIESLPESQL